MTDAQAEYQARKEYFANYYRTHKAQCIQKTLDWQRRNKARHAATTRRYQRANWYIIKLARIYGCGMKQARELINAKTVVPKSTNGSNQPTEG